LKINTKREAHGILFQVVFLKSRVWYTSRALKLAQISRVDLVLFSKNVS